MNQNAAKKQIILDAARVLILKYGLPNLVMDEVAMHCGMSKKTIYEIFIGKDALIQELTIAFLKEERTIWEREIQQYKAYKEKFRYILQFLFRAIELLPYENMMLMRKKHPQSYSLLEDFYQQVSKTLEETISEGQMEGVFDPEIKGKVFTELLLQQFMLLQKNYKELKAEGTYKTWKAQIEYSLDKIILR